MEREHEEGESEKVQQQEGESEVEGEKDPKSDLVEPEIEKKKAPPAKSGKVEVRLQAAGDAPIMKQKNYKVGCKIYLFFSFTHSKLQNTS